MILLKTIVTMTIKACELVGAVNLSLPLRSDGKPLLDESMFPK